MVVNIAAPLLTVSPCGGKTTVLVLLLKLQRVSPPHAFHLSPKNAASLISVYRSAEDFDHLSRANLTAYANCQTGSETCPGIGLLPVVVQLTARADSARANT